MFGMSALALLYGGDGAWCVLETVRREQILGPFGLA